MTSRERLRRAYFHEEMDRPGVYVRTGYPQGDPTYDRVREFLRVHSDLKLGWGAKWAGADLPVDTHTEPHSADFDRLVTVLHTPAGDLRSVCLRSLRGQPGFQEEHFLKDPEDAEKYLSLSRHPAACDPSGFFRAEQDLGSRGIVEVGLGMNPAGQVAELFGSETFAILSLTHRDIVHELCRVHRDLLLDRVKCLTRLGVGPHFSYLGQEYVAPPLHGPADFEDFNVRYDKPVLDLIHEAGGRVHVHCHGALGKVFGGFLRMGADVLHPIEPPPMGDLTAAQAKAQARGRLCMEGNIQIADVYEKSPAEIRGQTEALIRDAFDDRRGLIVCPSASLYIRGAGESCFPRIRAMVEAVLS